MKYIYLAILLSLFSCKKELDYEQVFGYVSKDSLLLIDVHSVSTMVEMPSLENEHDIDKKITAILKIVTTINICILEHHI